MLRMDITKKIEELAKKSAQVGTLQEEVSHTTKKVAELMKKENDLAGLQNDMEAFV